MSNIDDLIRHINSLQAQIDELVKPEITPGAFLILQDQKASGTNGGTFTSGAWRTRDLNTTVFNSIIGFSLAANQFTLLSGTYIIRASAPGVISARHATRLQNITDASTVLAGTSEFSSLLSDPTEGFTTRSFIIGDFTITATKVFEIQHRCDHTQATLGFGVAAGGSFAVANELYTEAQIWKIA